MEGRVESVKATYHAFICLFFLVLFLGVPIATADKNSCRVQLTQEERDFLKQHSVIILGTDKNWSPYVIVSQDGSLTGYDIDILHKINTLTGANFQLRTGKWAQMLKMAKARMIDGLSTSTAVGSRTSFLNFSNPYTKIRKRVVVPRGNPKHIETADDLEGKIIVVQDGNANSEKIARLFKPSKVIKAASPQAMLDALITGKADATFDRGTFLYTIREYGVPFIQVAFSLQEAMELVFSLRNDWPEAMSILNKGLAAISDKEKQQLTKKWFSIDGDQDLQDNKIILTEQERTYLSTISSIPMCIDPSWMPYEELSRQGKHVGLVADFMAIIAARVGKPFRLVKTRNWTESLRYAQERKCAILPGAVPTPNRREYLHFSIPYVSFPLVVATGLDKVFIEDFASVADQTFAIVRDYAAIELLKQKYPQMHIVEVADPFAGLSMVREKKVFGYIDTVASIGYQFQEHGVLDVKISGQIDVDYDITVGVRSDAPELLSIINKAILSVSSAERQSILNHWLVVRFEKGFDYSFFWKFGSVIAVLLLLILYRYTIISRYNRQLLSVNAQLDTLYKTDRLTGVSNRHVLDEELEKELARADRYETPFAVIMLDIDNFKKINDTFGHYSGDRVLQEIAGLLVSNVRKTDTVGRWGGEEFLIICPQTDLSGAKQLAEHLRTRIEHLELSDIAGSVTASFGVAPYLKDDSSETLIQRTDAALYGAKEASRNCVMVAEVNTKPAV